MRRTLLITLEYPPQRGGVAEYLAGFAEAFNPALLTVLAPRQRNNFLFDEKQAYTIIREPLLYRLLWPRWLRAFFAARRIIRIQVTEQVIISHLLPMGYVALLLRKPYIVITHGMDVALAARSPWKSFFANLILARAKTVIANSEFTKGMLVKMGVAPERIRVVYPGVAAPAARNIRRNPRQLLTVARLVERKGIDRTIEAMRLLRERYPDLRYVIAGEGPYHGELERLVRSRGLGDLIELRSAVSDEEREELYATSSVFVMPSRQIGGDVEGFGTVFLEANAYGLPVIGGDCGGIPEAVIEGETGLLVNPESPEDIAAAISKLIDDPDLAQRLGTAGKARVEREFRWKDRVEEIRSIV